METMFALFKEKAQVASAEVHRFASPALARDFIAGLLRDQGGTALWAPGRAREAFGKLDLPGLSLEVTRETAAEASVGISQADWALADTGTLVQDSTEVAQRLVSTLPPVHVAVIGTDRLLPDLGAALERIHPDRASYLAFITGPSRTADIERVLTIGVHGPSRLLVLFVEGIPS